MLWLLLCPDLGAASASPLSQVAPAALAGSLGE